MSEVKVTTSFESYYNLFICQNLDGGIHMLLFALRESLGFSVFELVFGPMSEVL